MTKEHHDAALFSTEPDAATPPLKRHQSLRPLSREHMCGLIQARNLQAAASADEPTRTRTLAEFTRIWKSELDQHFADEERLLLPLINSPQLKQRLLDEHRVLRDLVGQIQCQPDQVSQRPELLETLGTFLHNHIRWEERVLFETIQHDHPDSLALMMLESNLIEQLRPGARPRSSLTHR